MARVAYPREYREGLVELVRAGRSPEKLAEEYEPCAATIRAWVKQADLDEGRRKDGLTTEERAEIVRLRRENKQLREERDQASARRSGTMFRIEAFRKEMERCY
jgi:transposase